MKRHTHYAAYAICLLLSGLMPGMAAATITCKFPANIQFTTAPSVECPSLLKTPAVLCDVDAAGNFIPYGKGLNVGPLTECVREGIDPPVTLRPDSGFGLSYTGSGNATHGGKCYPPRNTGTTPVLSDGTLVCPVSASNPSASPPCLPSGCASTVTIPGVNATSGPVKNGVLSAVPAGAFIPVTFPTTNPPTASLKIGNVSVTIPSNLSPTATKVVYNNTPGAAIGTSFTIPTNAIYAAIAPTQTTTNVAAGLAIPAGTEISVPAGSITLDLTQPGSLTLPEGGSVNGHLVQMPKPLARYTIPPCPVPAPGTTSPCTNLALKPIIPGTSPGTPATVTLKPCADSYTPCTNNDFQFTVTPGSLSNTDDLNCNEYKYTGSANGSNYSTSTVPVFVPSCQGITLPAGVTCTPASIGGDTSCPATLPPGVTCTPSALNGGIVYMPAVQPPCTYRNEGYAKGGGGGRYEWCPPRPPITFPEGGYIVTIVDPSNPYIYVTSQVFSISPGGTITTTGNGDITTSDGDSDAYTNVGYPDYYKTVPLPINTTAIASPLGGITLPVSTTCDISMPQTSTIPNPDTPPVPLNIPNSNPAPNCASR